MPGVSAGDHRQHKIFFVYDTGDRHPEDVRHDERHGYISEHAMQFANSAFRFLAAPVRDNPGPGFLAVCLGIA